MRCYFVRDGHIAGVEVLPPGISVEDAIARAHTLSSKRKGPFDGLEVWDRGRAVFRHPDPGGEMLAPISRLASLLARESSLTSSPSLAAE
jgi:hypothetical protein